MIIEIRKAGFANKGAEMMLMSVIEAIRQHYGDPKIVVAPDIQMPFEERMACGLWHRFEWRRMGFDFGLLLKFLPLRLRRRFGFILRSEIDVVLDAAGFAYSDQWGDHPTRDLARRIFEYKNNNQKYILLPQALGPYSTPQIRAAMTNVINDCDLLYARDSFSFAAVNDILDVDKVKQSPDFTIKLKPIKPKDIQFADFDDAVALVPNMRMIDKGETSVEDYIKFFVDVTSFCLSSGKSPFFLIHETVDDKGIIDQIQSELAQNIPTIDVLNGAEAKWIIGQCDFIVASRYHAIVSALAPSIPAIGTGWSHKYSELFQEYGVTELLLSDLSNKSNLNEVLASVTKKHDSIVKNLSHNSKQVQLQVDEMWSDVFKVIEN